MPRGQSWDMKISLSPESYNGNFRYIVTIKITNA